MWIDTHAHLYECTLQECEERLRAAREAGVGVVVSTATAAGNVPQVIDHTRRFNEVWAAAGISPFDVDEVPPDWSTQLTAWCAHEKVIAVGEIGVDTTNPTYPPLEKQEPLFRLQLEVARACQLPAIIHSRGCEAYAAAVCGECGVADAVFHCFTGTQEDLEAVVDRGYYVSLSGIITFKNFALRQYIRDIPLDRLLIETDCPYLAPVPYRGKQNQPAWAGLVGEEVARLYGVAADELARVIEQNFRRVFKKYTPQQGTPGTYGTVGSH